LPFDLCKKQFSAPFAKPALITRKSKIACLSRLDASERESRRRRQVEKIGEGGEIFALAFSAPA